MTRDEKELLLKVLCAMLPYKLHCSVFRLNGDIKENDDLLYGVIGDNVVTLKSDKDECLMYYQIKPYLRPMSSMTKEERQESRWYQQDAKSDDFILYMNRYEEWLDSKHFDWRTDGNGKTMIEIGLALEAPIGMYNILNKSKTTD